MWLWLLALGCGEAEAPPPPLSVDAEQRILLGPLAHAWRDLARAQGDLGAAAREYRALAAALSAFAPTDPELVAWRDLLVAAAGRDLAWAEALAAGETPPGSDLGPVSTLRAVAMGAESEVSLVASAHVLLQDPPWKDWRAETTPWLETVGFALDAAPPFAVDAHWGGWQPRDANRQVASLAYTAGGRGQPSGFVAGLQRQTGPGPLRRPLGCDLYIDLAGEPGPPHSLAPAPGQAMAASTVLARVRSQDQAGLIEALEALVRVRDPRCPGAELFRLGLVGRARLAAEDPAARGTLEQAVSAGRAALGLAGS